MASVLRERTPPGSLRSQIQSESSNSSSADQTDEWFRNEFERLYDQVANFIDKFFCQFKDIPLESSLSPWIEMSSEFVRYSVIVAEPDDSLGGWNRILLERNQRRHLLVGILARVLEAKIFRELLFGASKGQKKQLEDLERSFTDVEGFGRTEKRANNVTMMLGNRPTPDFDIDVTRLSKQIMMLFQPLSRFLDSAVGHRESPAPSSEDQFRSIHGIVAMAARLSIRVRVSPTIFYFYSESPGNFYEPDEQSDMDYSAYVASKSAFARGHDNRPNDNERHSKVKRHRALVKFAGWPSVKRYSPGIGNREGTKHGFRVYTICNSRVVYYWGLEDCEQRTWVDLQTFIEQQRRKRRSRVINMANDTASTISTVTGQAMARIGTYQVAIIVAASIYLVIRDYMQGRDPFGWQ